MIPRELLDQTLFWNAVDLERKLADFKVYYNLHRTHSSLSGDTPAEAAGCTGKMHTKLAKFRWQTHCRGLNQLPAAARVSIRQGHGMSATRALTLLFRGKNPDFMKMDEA